MGRRKKEIVQLKTENISDIYNEINEETQIINDSINNIEISTKKIKKKDSNDDKKMTLKIIKKEFIENNDDNNKILEKINTIEQIGKKYIPNFKRKKDEIISDMLNMTKTDIERNIIPPNVYTIITINGNIFYRDNTNKILNSFLKDAGSYTRVNNIFTYTLN
ncbi:hypothetical protein BMW23_0591 [Bodo saltans virus]|jgi:hypothetical protein|uniref:Uncharacterized protein n=1 Tax=Bodo saltans virus TaxID=2024608 RepID=A0A2H4UUU9_9VIRU|nr:hypothetical protein QJ851_gp0574 [Bodo saltans virus]ATZ80637.1 hypothetical protein BMW23_0591 [Bodo saltans virus]